MKYRRCFHCRTPEQKRIAELEAEVTEQAEIIGWLSEELDSERNGMDGGVG